jgi:hypothetical protein
MADMLHFQIRSPQLVRVTPNLVSSADSSTFYFGQPDHVIAGYFRHVVYLDVVLVWDDHR